ncbi:DUF4832 domain-containing protein [Reinekea blandensis]|uniref:DUF4832 domain-containing protein n=1 Tax=Reinekea blandensis MED297 TaxID=314283 RepID=A4BB90_9GAMM|nr:DUF4832 domain-containing protein [Reinekea blandensis]EAR10703.1 hypothetical protein MED297_11825 [Reinekea sp. MED297] [Reinekea blandensis MED297]
MSKRVFFVACLAGAILSACQIDINLDDGITIDLPEDDVSGDQPGDGVFELAPNGPVSFQDAITDNVNPERGFYAYVDLVSERDFDYVREEGYTLAYSYIRLDDYRSQRLPESLLDSVQAGFDAARDSGIKIIPRFAYNFGPYPNSEPDASYEWVSRHIEQVAPLLQANADVIAVVQAGFIGAWGEWHTSTNGLLDDPATWQGIIDKLMAAVPEQRAIQLRYPAHKGEMYSEPLTVTEAFGDTRQARLGHHNDCFLASDTDMGTYPSDEVAQWKAYLDDDTRYVPMGGETCAVSARSGCDIALDEMSRFHYSFLNSDYHPEVLSGWEANGCYAEIEERLGYRFELEESSLPSGIVPGGRFEFDIRIENTGFAAPFNERPVYLVLYNEGDRYQVRLADEDVRLWQSGTVTALTGAVQVPASITEGTYDLGLWLPDAAASLQQDSQYAIRIPNAMQWHEQTGINDLVSVTIDDSEDGSSDESAESFELLVSE